MRDIASNLRFRIHTTHNESFVAYVDSSGEKDDLGALYYVVAVLLIYALSIVMMIASHIRKNQQDNQLRTYLKEMAVLRKNDRREKIIGKCSKPTVVTKLHTTNVAVGDVIERSPVKDLNDKCKNSLHGINSNSDQTNHSHFQMPCDFSIDVENFENPLPRNEQEICLQSIDNVML